MIFRSKVGKISWVTLILLFVAGVSSVVTIPEVQTKIAVGLVSLFLLIVCIWLGYSTKYELTEDKLIIGPAPFRTIIPLQSISTVRKTRNPMSSPALSLDRLEISYGRYDVILISPKDSSLFLKLLKERAPSVQIEMDRYV